MGNIRKTAGALEYDTCLKVPSKLPFPPNILKEIKKMKLLIKRPATPAIMIKIPKPALDFKLVTMLAVPSIRKRRTKITKLPAIWLIVANINGPV